MLECLGVIRLLQSNQGRWEQGIVDLILEHAIAYPSSDSVGIIRYMLGRDYKLSEDHLKVALIRGSFEQDAQEVIEYVVESHLCDSLRHEFVYASVRPGGPKYIQCVRDWLTDEVIYLYRNHLDSTRWLVQACGMSVVGDYDRTMVRTEDDALAIVAWRNENGLLQSTRDSEHALGSAARNGWLRVVQWFHDHPPDVSALFAMDLAAMEGQLEVVQWLHANRTEGCTTVAMDYASAAGHLHVVRWLNTHRSEGCTAYAHERAAARGNLPLVQYLFEHRSEGNVTLSMAAAAGACQLDVLVWLYENCSGGCTPCVYQALLSKRSYVYDDNKRGGSVLNMLRWLRAHPSQQECQWLCLAEEDLFEDRDSCFQQAVMEGDLQLLEFLNEHEPDSILWDLRAPAEAVKTLACCKHLCALQWLYARFPHAIDWQALRADHHVSEETYIVEWLDSVLQ